MSSLIFLLIFFTLAPLRAQVQSAIVGLLLITSLFSNQGSSGNDLEAFQSPPDWPNS